MAVQYKIGYGLQYTVHEKTLSSPHLKRTRGIKVPVEEEPNQPPLTYVVYFRSRFLLVAIVRAAIKASSRYSSYLILNIVDKSNMS